MREHGDLMERVSHFLLIPDIVNLRFTRVAACETHKCGIVPAVPARAQLQRIEFERDERDVIDGLAHDLRRVRTSSSGIAKGLTR